MRCFAAWSLAPAYDLTFCTNGYSGDRATSVNNHGIPSIEDMLVVGEGIRIPKKKGLEMIQYIAGCCEELLSEEYPLTEDGGFALKDL